MLKLTKKRKKKHNKIIVLAKNKLNIIDTLLSSALNDSEISHEEFTNIINEANIDDRQSFSQFYLPNVMVKDYNVIIDKLAFFDLPIRTEEEAYEKIIDISRNNEYTTDNLLDYDYF